MAIVSVSAGEHVPVLLCVSGDSPFCVCACVLEETVSTSAPHCPFTHGHLLPSVPQPCSLGVQMLAHPWHLPLGYSVWVLCGQTGVWYMQPWTQQRLPHPDTICCTPQASSVPSPAPRATEPWRS